MADGRIEIEIILDDGSLKKGFIKAEQIAEVSGKKAGDKFESGFKGGISGISSQFNRLRNQILGIGTILTATFGGKRIIDAARVQEQAVANLNIALQNSGTFSAKASESIQKYAASIERTTATSDEAFLKQVALARTFVTTNDAAVRLATVGLDLAAARGISFDSAVLNLGKTLSGLTGELGESVSSIRTLTAEQLKAGGAIDLLQKQFGGTAAKAVQTFGGSLQQLGNKFGSLLENLGNIIIKSPTVIAFFISIGDALDGLNKRLSGLNLEKVFDLIIVRVQTLLVEFGLLALFFKREAIFLLIKNGFTLITTAIGATNKAAKLLTISLNILKGAFGLGILIIVDKIISKFFELRQKTKSIGDSFKALGLSIKIGFLESVLSTVDLIIEKMPGFAAAIGLSGGKAVEALKDSINEAKLALDSLLIPEDKRGGAIFAGGVGAPIVKEELFGLSQAFGAFFKGADEGLEDFRNKAEANFKAIGSAAALSLGRGVGTAFAAMGKAIAEGKNGLEAFAKSMLQTFANVAINLGTEFILMGTAYAVSGVANLMKLAPGLIAAGAALATFGGVLSAVGASSPAGGSSSGGGGGPAAPGGDDFSGDGGFADDEELRRNTSVTVNVDGTVLDPVAVGTQIAELLAEITDSNDIKVRTG